MVHAQKNVVDSLTTVLQNHRSDDSEKVDILNNIAQIIYKENPSLAKEYADQSERLSNKLNYQKGKAVSLWINGLLVQRRDKNQSLEYFQNALSIAHSINDKQGMANYLMASANILLEMDEESQAMNSYQQAIEMAREIKDKNLEIKNLINLSRVHNKRGEPIKALEQLEKAASMATQIDDKPLMASCYTSISTIFQRQGNFPLAIEFLLKAKAINEQTDNKPGIWTNLINLAGIKAEQKDYEGALSNIEEGLEIAKKMEDDSRLSICYTNIGNIYLTMGDARALENLQQGLALTGNNNSAQKINILTSIGTIYGKRGDNINAMLSLNRAKELAENGGLKYEMAQVWYSIGNQLLLQKEYAKSLDFTLKSNELAGQLGIISLQKETNNLLSEIYAMTNDFKKAYEHHKEYKSLNDSIYNENNIRKIADLESAYKFDKERQQFEMERENRALEIRNQRTLIYSLLAASTLLLLLTLTMIRLYRLKRKTNKALVEQKSKIEEFNEEYRVVNELLSASNKELTTAKQKIEENEEKLQLIISNSNDAILLLDFQGGVQFLSDAALKITGLDENDIRGLKFDAIHPDDVVKIVAHWNKITSDKTITDRVQFRYRNGTDGYIWLEAVTHNHLNHRAINAILSNIRNIDVQKKAEEALIEKERLQKKLLENELERANYELETNQKNMAAAALKLVQNAERDARNIEALEDIAILSSNEAKTFINLMISQYKSPLYDSNWEEFETLFMKVHHSFHDKMNRQYPNLTLNERRLCAFLKLNMNNKDIAKITFQSEEALKKARLRLRKKLGINRDTNLSGFIQSL